MTDLTSEEKVVTLVGGSHLRSRGGQPDPAWETNDDLLAEWRRVQGFDPHQQPQGPGANPRAESVAQAIAGLDDVRAAMIIKKGLLIGRPRSRAMQLLKAVLRIETGVR
jgi:hypothetical protein